MRITFRSKNIKSPEYLWIKSCIFRLPEGTRITVERDETTCSIQDGTAFMQWRGCHVRALNGYNIFEDPVPAYVQGYGAEEFVKLVSDAKAEFILEDDTQIECEFFSIEP